MINILEGTIGSGKSYEAVVYHALPILQSGRKIKTNLPLNVEFISLVLGDHVADLIELVEPTAENPIPFSTIVDYQDEWRHPETNQGTYFIIDECHKALSKQKYNQPLMEYYAESRHAGHDHLLITQSCRKIARDIVDMAQLVYRVRKNTALGSSTSYVRKVQDGYRGEVVNTSIRRYEKKYFKYYQSHTQSNAAVMEANAKDIKPIWQNWSVYGFGLTMLPLCYMVYAGKLNIFNGQEEHFAAMEQEQAINVPPPPIPKYKQVADEIIPPVEVVDLAVEEKIVLPDHPYSKVILMVAGIIERQDKNLILFQAMFNGQKRFVLTSEQLKKAKYQVTYVSECSVKIEFAETDYSEYLTCSAASQEMNGII